ncbi:hypothetical protein [Armatimonas sp.]
MNGSVLLSLRDTKGASAHENSDGRHALCVGARDDNKTPRFIGARECG